METRITASISLGDAPLTSSHLKPFDPGRPNERMAHFAFGSSALFAYTPESLEQVADAMLKLAGEMRADRTAHEQDEARKDAAINRTTAAIDRFVAGKAVSA